MIFDYETFKLIWWLFVGVLLIGFALTDGFDMGVGSLLPFIAKKDDERRVLINSIGPTWDGNQVWFITAGGALFAAWPLVYSAAFSGFYFALILVLFALILRPVGFDYRSKLDNPAWRNTWDWGLFIGGAVPALVFGVAFGNLLQGVPFHYDDDLRVFYTGSFIQLLNPFALLVGLVSISMLMMHGGTFLQMKTEGVIQARARGWSILTAIFYSVAFTLAGLWVALALQGYRLVDSPDVNGVVIPTAKTVEIAVGAWMSNFSMYPWMIAAPAASYVGTLMVVYLSKRNLPGMAFLGSSLAVTGTILTAGLSMFPFVMPSSTEPNHSLTLWDAVSSHFTLALMFWAVIIFLPIVLAYTAWVYRVMRGKVTAAQIQKNTHTVY